MPGIERIAAERQRQIEVEGWTPEHDDEHDDGDLAMAAVCYAAPESIYRHGERQVQINSSRGIGDCYQYDFKTVTDYHDPWPWDEEDDKRGKHDEMRRLVIAGALIVAEIDRLERKDKP